MSPDIRSHRELFRVNDGGANGEASAGHAALETGLGPSVYRYVAPFAVIALVAVFCTLLLADQMLINVPAGHVGVLWRRLADGTVVDQGPEGEGLEIIWPWNVMTLYPIRFQQVERDLTAIDKDGLRFNVKVSTRFRLKRDTVGLLHQRIGPDYLEVAILPEVVSQTLRVISRYPAEQVYTTKRDLIQEDINTYVRKSVASGSMGDLIEIEDVLIRQITLPSLVALAIEEKNRQLQLDQEWTHRISREHKELERKLIEGDAIRRFQHMVGGKVSEGYLRLKGLEATLKLAESSNAKIVIIGSGPHGLPLLLGSDFSSPPVTRQRVDAAPDTPLSRGGARGADLGAPPARASAAAPAGSVEHQGPPMSAATEGTPTPTGPGKTAAPQAAPAAQAEQGAGDFVRWLVRPR
jgi:regulator of protease activity HflC (stomatin/prohibitin superfamily)